jgi:DNA invertase Pin-like site-specific DNA recombinase
MRGYVRVSTFDQHPEVQIERLIAAGVDTELIYVDKGQSGAKAKRPAWNRLLADMEPGDKLVAVRLDRIGRSVRNLFDTMDELKSRGCYLHVIDQGIDTQNPTGMGKLFFGILAVIAEFERDLIIERTTDGQATVRLTGNMRRIMGGYAPLGFRDPGGDDDRRDWELDPLAADWLAAGAKLVLDDPMHRAGTAYRALPPMHDSRGTAVTLKMFRAALLRPASAGLIEVRGVVLGPADCGGPLDEQTYKRLRVIFAARAAGRPPKLESYPFGVVLACDKCGNQLTGQPGYKGRRTYGCRNPHKVGGKVITPCRGVSVPADDVEALLRVTVEEWLASPAGRAAAADAPRASGRREELEAVITEQQEAIGDLAAKRAARYIRPERCAELSGEAEAVIDAARAELDELDRLEDEGGLPDGQGWDDMTVPERVRAVQRAALTPIRVRPGNGGPRAVPAEDRVLIIPR